MELAANLKNETLFRSASLGDTIARLWTEFTNVKRRLSEAHSEIHRLKDQLARQRPSVQPGLDFGALRRRVAFYCHPDRGGDVALMSELNNLFDVLEQTGGVQGGQP